MSDEVTSAPELEHGEEFNWKHAGKLAKSHAVCNGKGYTVIQFQRSFETPTGKVREPVVQRMMCRCVRKRLDKLGLALVWREGVPYLPKGVVL